LSRQVCLKATPSAFWAHLLLLPLQAVLAQPMAFAETRIACPAYVFQAQPTSFDAINPASEVIAIPGGHSIPFPANAHSVLYRGITAANGQFDAVKASRAMLGDPDIFFGSPMFWAITQVLTGQKALNDRLFTVGTLQLPIRQYLEDRQVLPDIQILLDCSNGAAFSQPEADRYAADLMDKYFARQSPGKLVRRYFDIADKSHYSDYSDVRGFGNNAVDFVIASAYDQIAAIYGKRVLVFEDREKRGVDLGHFNYKRNRIFYHHWVDNGEVDLPGYLPASAVLGYQEREVERPPHGSPWGQALYANPIVFSLQKVRFEKRDYVLVLDGKGAACETRGKDGRHYFCAAPRAELEKAPVPYAVPVSEKLKHRVPAMGVLAKCGGKKGDDCGDPQRLLQWYGLSSAKALPADVRAQLEAIRIGEASGAAVKLFEAPPELASTGIHVVSATYRPEGSVRAGRAGAVAAIPEGNVTAQARAYCSGKDTVDYLVSKRFIGEPAPGLPMAFEISWTCPEDRSRVIKRKIPAPAEGESLKISCPPEEDKP
jgi:hypothetical protein